MLSDCFAGRNGVILSRTNFTEAAVKALITGILLLSFLTFAPTPADSLQVYRQETQAFADVTVYVTDTQAFADCSIYVASAAAFANGNAVWFWQSADAFADISVHVTDTQAFAQVTVFFTTSEAFASCDVDWMSFKD